MFPPAAGRGSVHSAIRVLLLPDSFPGQIHPKQHEWSFTRVCLSRGNGEFTVERSLPAPGEQSCEGHFRHAGTIVPPLHNLVTALVVQM